MDSIQKLAREIGRIDRRLTNLSTTPQLAYSSIENGAVDAYDEDGNLVLSVGTQFDGTHAAVSLNGPPPPTPTAPVVVPGQLSLTVRWDGFFLDPEGLPDPLSFAPTDFSRIEVHVSTEQGFKAETSLTLRGTIETPRGADVVIAPMQVQPYYIKLIARTLSGNFSLESPEVTGTPGGAVDQAALNAELETVRDRIQEVADDAQGALTGVLEAVNADLEAANDLIASVASDAAGDLDEAMADVAGDLVELGQEINLARIEPITNERFSENSLTVWPFMQGAIPAGAFDPGSIKASDLADFSIVARKFNTNRHQLY